MIRKNDPKARIAYVKGDDLTNELVDAIREGKTADMREKYRQADLLLVDDGSSSPAKSRPRRSSSIPSIPSMSPDGRSF